MIGTTITQFLIEEQRRYPSATGDLTSVINDIVTACKTISTAMRYGALSDEDLFGVSSNKNVQGETQKTLDILANDLFLRRTEFGGHVAAMVSEEMTEIYQLPAHFPKGRYLLLYDPVDGSSNINDTATIGTIFSILKRADSAEGQPAIEEFLQPGSQQVCAGYAVYGPNCMIVMTTGNTVNGFTLDPLVGEFVLTHPEIRIRADSNRLFINPVFSQQWEEPVRSFMADCLAGAEGPLGKQFEMRWSAGAVADVHRLLLNGGMYMSPLHEGLRRKGLEGQLRLLYEVNPLAFIAETAGGLATDGIERVLDIVPASIHQRSPLILGHPDAVEGLLGAQKNA
jgi:fructose-1,6-bisphosphatase I